MKVNINSQPPKLSAKQKHLLDKYIEEEINEKRLEFLKAVDAMVLYSLHKNFGFGKKRLSEYFKTFINEYNKFVDNYEIEGNWVAGYKLKEETGLDIDELHKELGL